MLFAGLIAQQRRRLGHSQSALAFQSGVSLPTIQKIEAGIGNPSLDTVEALISVLGYSIRFAPKLADWEFLQACGLPLTGEVSAAIRPNKDRLLQETYSALIELEEVRDTEAGVSRKKEALLALLLALKTHYPSVYKEMKKNEWVQNAELQFNQSKLIKLKRIALSKLSKFL
jgi:transcriptional regulator with XRE-family HTH domain